YREDPIRMLRAVRLSAKLGLTLDAATREPIRSLAPLMERVPPARLFDEMLKLLLSGHASACLRPLRHTRARANGRACAGRPSRFTGLPVRRAPLARSARRLARARGARRALDS